MIDLNKLVRENVLKLSPYSSARDDFKGKTGIFMDANENPYGNLNRYPDPYQKKLKSLISKVKGIEEEKIFLGNGSDEIIDLTFRVFCRPGVDKALTFTPTYGMYEVSASVNVVRKKGAGIENAAIGITGVGPSAYRATAVEQALRAASIAEAARHAADGIEPLSDSFASGEYRQHLAAVYARRALESALNRK